MRKRLNVRSYSKPVNWVLLFLRIAVAGYMLTHGVPKFMQVLAGDFRFLDPLGMGATTSLLLATFAEFLCSLLILIGLATRFATIPLLVTMFTALFVVHASDPVFSHYNIILYVISYVILLITGSGKYSVDYLMFKA